MAVKINQRLIRNLDAPAHGNRLVWDTELKGFGLRITRTGAVSFFLNYRNAHGLQRRYKIGNAPEWTAEAARAEAAELKPKINKGFDPLAAKQQAVRAQQEASGESTFRDLAKEYQERHYGPDASPNTKRNDREMLELIILPRFGSRPVQSITTRDIEKLHADLKATKSRANRTLSLLSAMFSEGIRWKYATENPTRDVQKYYEPPRERWLGNDELARLHAALDKCRDKVAANAIRLIALTGSRRGEVLQATWDEIDLERGVWTKPSHHTKQKTIEHVPLSAAAVELLRKIKPKVATGPLFPGRDGIAARADLRKPWAEVCKAAGLAVSVVVTKQGKRGPITFTKWNPTVRIHDLRHTFASHLVSRGTSLQIVGALLGHTQSQTTKRYAHLADAALRDATNNFGKIFNGPSGGLQVVESPKGAPAHKRAEGG